MESDRPASVFGPEPQALDRCEETLWVIRAREGNAEAFGRLMARHERPLLYYLRRFIGRTEAALDAHQEVWLDAFRGLRRLHTPEAFRSWLYRIAHNKAARYIRREIRDEQVIEPLNESHHEVCVLPDSPFDAEAIHRGLDRLPALQREVLTLYYLQDLSQDEMALALDCPVGTIKSRLHHARDALRSLRAKENL
jgi:RNA polymerase sigma-70 factor, ECF subfamily